MCAIKPIFAFEVTKDRLDKALRVIGDCRTKLTQDKAFEVFMELGFGDAIKFPAQGPLTLEMTDLQLVAAAAALAAVVEAGGRLAETAA